jgi:hypothetical protein
VVRGLKRAHIAEGFLESAHVIAVGFERVGESYDVLAIGEDVDEFGEFSAYDALSGAIDAVGVNHDIVSEEFFERAVVTGEET